MGRGGTYQSLGCQPVERLHHKEGSPLAWVRVRVCVCVSGGMGDVVALRDVRMCSAARHGVGVAQVPGLVVGSWDA